MYEYRARLMQRSNGRHAVYDADTIWLSVDLGFGINFDLGPCRLYGINAPEMRGTERHEGVRSRDYVRSLLAPHHSFTVRTFKDTKGKYGRYLVEIMLDDEPRSVNQMLVDEGLAVEADY